MLFEVGIEWKERVILLYCVGGMLETGVSWLQHQSGLTPSRQ